MRGLLTQHEELVEDPQKAAEVSLAPLAGDSLALLDDRVDCAVG